MTKITGIRPQVGSLKEKYYRISAPNIKSLCDKAITGKIEQGDLNHLVVHLEKKTKAFDSSESRDIAKFIFLPVLDGNYPEAMKETARFGLELLAAEDRSGHWTAKEIIEKLDKAEPPKPGPIAPPHRPIVTPSPLATKAAPVPTAAQPRAIVPAASPARPVTPPPLSKPAPVAPVRVAPEVPMAPTREAVKIQSPPIAPQQIEPAKASPVPASPQFLQEVLSSMRGMQKDTALHLMDSYQRVFHTDRAHNTSLRELFLPSMRAMAMEPIEPRRGDQLGPLIAAKIIKVVDHREEPGMPGKILEVLTPGFKSTKDDHILREAEVVVCYDTRVGQSGSTTPHAIRPVTSPPLPKPAQVAPAREVPLPTNPVATFKFKNGNDILLLSEVTYHPILGNAKMMKTGILSEACVFWKVRWEKGTRFENELYGNPVKVVLSQPKSFGNIEYPKGTEFEIDNLKQMSMLSTTLLQPARFGTTDLPVGTRITIWTDGKLYQATLYRAQSFYGVEYPVWTPVWFDRDEQYVRAIKIVEKDGKTIGGEHFSESMTIDFLASGQIKTAHYHDNQHNWQPLYVAVNVWGRTFELRNAYVHFNDAGEKETIELIEGQELFGHSLPAGTVIVQEKTGKIVAQTPDGKSKILAS